MEKTAVTEVSRINECLKGLWDKQSKMNDVSRVIANSFALGLQMGRKAERGEAHDRSRVG